MNRSMPTCRTALPVLVIAAASLTTGGSASRATIGSQDEVNPRAEPPLEMVLEVDGQQVEVVDGRPFEIAVGERKVNGVVRVSPTRKLTVPGLSFRYPRHMAFEYDEAEDVPTWTLDGNNTVLMLFDHGQDVGAGQAAEAYAEGVEDMFGAGVRGRGEATIRLGGREVRGRRLRIVVAGTPILQEIFGVRAGGRTYLLVVQDSAGDAERLGEETRGLHELLEKTWQARP